VPKEIEPLAVGKAEELAPPGEVSIWALGDMVPLARQAAEQLASDGVATGVVNARFINPLDTSLLDEHADSTRLVVTIENGVANGGFGSAVLEHLNDGASAAPVLRLGWPDAFVPQGNPAQLRDSCGLTPDGVVASIRAALTGK
jgi:1-deoxy-D-xylulose-5-phosphate synthase